MIGFLQFVKDKFKESANTQGVYVDFTMGKGRDTLFLCSIAPYGKIYSFDIQPEALKQTQELLDENNISNASLILDSHHNFKKYVKEEIDGGLFNLGFLPGGDRTRTTLLETTLSAVKGVMEALKMGGILGIAVYPGHAEGEKEGEELQKFFKTVDKKFFDIYLYRLLNVSDSPYVIIVEKRK